MPGARGKTPLNSAYGDASWARRQMWFTVYVNLYILRVSWARRQMWFTVYVDLYITDIWAFGHLDIWARRHSDTRVYVRVRVLYQHASVLIPETRDYNLLRGI